jgi:hypothetical protein
MKSRITLGVVAVSSAAMLVVPATVATAKPKTDKPAKAKFGVSKLSILHAKKERDVATEDAMLKAQVKVKDHSKAFDPASVTLKVTKDGTDDDGTVKVDAKLVGKSKVVSNWRAKLTIPAGSVAPGETATYCIKVVKVDPEDTEAVPTAIKAKGLQGRDCVTVVNSATE